MGRHEGAQVGGQPLSGCGASGAGRSPTPNHPSSGRAAGARYPLAVDAGGVGVGTRHLAHSGRSCELALRAVGGARGCRGGGALACVSGVLDWALSHARPPVPAACGWGALATGCGCGGCGCGDPSPTQQHALLRASFAVWGRNKGARGGHLLPACGPSKIGRSPTPDRLSLGRAAWARYLLAAGVGCAGVGTRRQPHSVRSCELALRVVGGAQGRPGGAPLASVWGVKG